MKQQTTETTYTEFHPRWYRKRVSVYWWLGQWQYLKFILRELSSVFVAWFVVLTLLQLRALRNGPEAYQHFQDWMRKPGLIALNLLSFFFITFHSVSWFNLAPSAMAISLRGKKLPGFLVSMPIYVAWVGISLAVGWLVMR